MTRFRDWPPWRIVENGRRQHSPCGSGPSDTASDLYCTRTSVIEGRPHQLPLYLQRSLQQGIHGLSPDGTADRSCDIRRVKDAKLLVSISRHRDCDCPTPASEGRQPVSSLDPNGPKAPNRPYHQSIFTALSMAVSMPSMNSSISASDCIAFLNRFRLASSKEI